MTPVDMLASEKTRRELKILMPMFQTLESDDRHRSYIAAAWSFIRAGDVGEALKLLDLLTPEYIQTVMPKQMDSDPVFNKMAEIVANALVEAKVHVPVFYAPDNSYVAPAGKA